MPYFIFDNFDARILAYTHSSVNKNVCPALKRFTQRRYNDADNIRESLRYLFSLCKAVNSPHTYICMYMYANEARHEGRGGGEGPQRGPVKLRISPPRETSIPIKSC